MTALHPRTPDLTGQRFARLTVTSFAGYWVRTDGDRAAAWHCTCDCGTAVAVRANGLRTGHTTSCGCYKRELNATQMTTHGLTDHPLYDTWQGIVQRCTNPDNMNYPGYGARGITVCAEWLESPEQFIADMGPSYREGLTIDRVDNNGPYSPTNCRWATPSEQSRNRRTNRWIEYGGVRMILIDWASALGLGEDALRARLDRHGWSVERALTEGVDPARLASVLAEHGGAA